MDYLPVDVGIHFESDYVTLLTTNIMKKYSKLNLLFIGGTLIVDIAIPAKEIITIAVLDKPLCQHGVFNKNDHFVPMLWWIDSNGSLNIYAENEVPKGTYIYFSDFYVCNPF